MQSVLDNFFSGRLRAFLFFFILWFGIVLSLGTLFSGFHFEDDQDIIQLNDEINLEKKGIAKTYIEWQKRDFETRFRPLFYLPRVFEAQAFGCCFPLWAAVVAFQCVLLSYFFFRFCRLVYFSNAEALLFTLLTTIGVQTSTFWRLLMAEPLALVFLSGGLIWMVKAIRAKKNKSRNDAVFILLMLCSSLCKESIMMILPAVAFLYLWIYGEEHKITFIEAAKKNRLIIFSLAIISTVELFVSWKLIGTNKTGFAGADDNYLNPLKAWRLIYVYCIKNFLFLIPLITVFYLAFVKRTLKKSLIKHQNALILFLLIVIPQFALYFKSGINERYLLPAITGICFLIIYILRQIKKEKLPFAFKSLFTLCIVIMLGVNSFRLVVRGYLYGEEGRLTKQFLTSIIAHTDSSSVIVIVGHPIVKFACPLAAYLRSVPVGRKHVYLCQDLFTYSPFEKETGEKERQRYFGNNLFDNLPDKNKTDIVAVYPELEEQFLRDCKWFYAPAFERMEFGRATFLGSPSYGKMIYYYRKKAS